ncbi:hypothetical protein QUF72_01165 [Desulfobacterales bacterium HSG2]|nr:hypothetical protein [Desulfobacterales bacterium HSG2]
MKTMITRFTKFALIWLLVFGVPLLHSAMAEGSDTEKYAWSENAGWVNFRQDHGGATVHETHLSGYAWAENIGWIKLGGTGSGESTPCYANDSATNWGVNRVSDTGELSGYAWRGTAGWINFNSADLQGKKVTVDSDGNSEGYAWSENAGWIHFKNTDIPYIVRIILAGDVNDSGKVDLGDAIDALKVVADLPSDVNVYADVNDDDRISIPEAVYALEEAGK